MSVYLVWGAPSHGKTFTCTWIAVKELLKGRRVFSNFPIIFTQPLNSFQRIINLFIHLIHIFKIMFWFVYAFIFNLIKKSKIWNKPTYTPKYKSIEYSTIKWEQDYIYSGLNRCVIILDEAYRYFNSRKKDVQGDVHTFFATNGHNNNDIYLIAQNYNRIDLVIRELANFFVFVSKFSNPFSIISSKGREQLTPLFFTVEYYISEEDYKYRRINRKAIYEKKRIFFSSKVANAYDTQYFKTNEKPIKFVRWSELIGDSTKLEPNIISEKEKEAIEEFSL